MYSGSIDRSIHPEGRRHASTRVQRVLEIDAFTSVDVCLAYAIMLHQEESIELVSSWTKHREQFLYEAS